MKEVSKGLLILYFIKVYITNNNTVCVPGSSVVRGKQGHVLLYRRNYNTLSLGTIP